MFQNLSSKLNGLLDKLTGRGVLSEADVVAALADIQTTLVEADVALDVARAFTARVKAKAVGADVLRAVKPGQLVVKIVYDELVNMLGSDAAAVDLNAPAPVVIMMVGLQGSGKTTTTAKLAKRLTTRQRKKVLMASLDTRRPAAQEQLRVLGAENAIATLPIIEGQAPLDIARRAGEAGRLGGYDVVLLDTAGRTTLDNELMNEVAAIDDLALPHEILLVADSLTGQDAVNTAMAFNARLRLTGIVLTRVDGDARGGAALSMRAVTGKPIKLLGTGETIDALDDFDPHRIAGRILDQGDIVALVEKAAETIETEKAEAMAKRLAKGEFTLDDLADQLRQMMKMGGFGSLMSLMPGMGKLSGAAPGLDDKLFNRQIALVGSMTAAERRVPHKILNFSRKKRIVAGAGSSLEELNKLLKMHRGMADMMKVMGKGKRGLGGGIAGALGSLFGGGAPLPSAEDMAAMQASFGGLPKGFTPPAGLVPGFGGGFKGLGGLPGLPKKESK